MVTVEIVTVGNEILLGLVQDTNSNYLCRVIGGMGGRVRHIAVVRDEVDEIASELNASLKRRADLVVTCGGLGPTDDDLTMAAVAEAVGRRLEMNLTARSMIEHRYGELASRGMVSSAAMTEARLKMACLPEGAVAIENPVGVAPAVVIDVRGGRIVSLPGVPAELKSIIEGPLQKLLGQIFGRGSYREREITVACGDESVLAPVLRKVVAAHPEVYIKSRANRFGKDVRFRIIISASAKTPEDASALVTRASDELTATLRESGIE